jgi:WhiB family transcriptional regulator, redox-sensing transcriptional regulator
MITAGTRELQILADVQEMGWVDQALCTEVDTGDLWFPEKGGSSRQAKRVCAGCPVRQACLEYALEHDIRWGVWGGTSERQRRSMRVGMRPTGRPRLTGRRAS